jgi:hypothetical protein
MQGGRKFDGNRMEVQRKINGHRTKNQRMLDEIPTENQWKSDRKLMDVRRNGGVTDGATNATTLQSARELRSDGGRDTTAKAL